VCSGVCACNHFRRFRQAYNRRKAGSLEESKYYLILSRDLRYGDVEDLQVMVETVAKLLAAYPNEKLDTAQNRPNGTNKSNRLTLASYSKFQIPDSGFQIRAYGAVTSRT
jgi:hypothetical protein